MTAQIKLAAPLASSFVVGCIGFGALHAQTKTSPAFWVTETLEVSDRAAFRNVVKAVPATLQPFGGQYIVLGGKIAPAEGSPPRRIAIVSFDSLEKAQQRFDSPQPSRPAPKPKSSPKYAVTSSKASPSRRTAAIPPFGPRG